MNESIVSNIAHSCNTEPEFIDNGGYFSDTDSCYPTCALGYFHDIGEENPGNGCLSKSIHDPVCTVELLPDYLAEEEAMRNDPEYEDIDFGMIGEYSIVVDKIVGFPLEQRSWLYDLI